jgi:hypothetical protein
MEVGDELLGVWELLVVELEVVDALGPGGVDVDSSDGDAIWVGEAVHYWYLATISYSSLSCCRLRFIHTTCECAHSAYGAAVYPQHTTVTTTTNSTAVIECIEDL